MLEMIFQYLPSSSTIHIHQKQFQTKVKCSKSWITIQKCHDFFDPTANSSMSQFDQNLRLVMIRLKIFSLQICTIWKIAASTVFDPFFRCSFTAQSCDVLAVVIRYQHGFGRRADRRSRCDQHYTHHAWIEPTNDQRNAPDTSVPWIFNVNMSSWPS